jgi:hypothetical protein
MPSNRDACIEKTTSVISAKPQREIHIFHAQIFKTKIDQHSSKRDVHILKTTYILPISVKPKSGMLIFLRLAEKSFQYLKERFA